MADQISMLLAELPDSIPRQARESFSSLTDVINLMVENGNDIEMMRQALGVGKGAARVPRGDDPLREIWRMVCPASGEITSDQFYGFDPIDKQGYQVWPQYLGIVGCCGVLDLIGFQAEKKCRRIEKIPNVRSDAAHIAMGAFCSALLSEDKRLVRRASAIYKYRDIGTTLLLVQ